MSFTLTFNCFRLCVFVSGTPTVCRYNASRDNTYLIPSVYEVSVVLGIFFYRDYRQDRPEVLRGPGPNHLFMISKTSFWFCSKIQPTKNQYLEKKIIRILTNEYMIFLFLVHNFFKRCSPRLEILLICLTRFLIQLCMGSLVKCEYTFNRGDLFQIININYNIQFDRKQK